MTLIDLFSFSEILSAELAVLLYLEVGIAEAKAGV
jgi:hypothetical protein